MLFFGEDVHSLHGFRNKLPSENLDQLIETMSKSKLFKEKVSKESNWEVWAEVLFSFVIGIYMLWVRPLLRNTSEVRELIFILQDSH